MRGHKLPFVISRAVSPQPSPHQCAMGGRLDLHPSPRLGPLSLSLFVSCPTQGVMSENRSIGCLGGKLLVLMLSIEGGGGGRERGREREREKGERGREGLLSQHETGDLTFLSRALPCSIISPSLSLSISLSISLSPSLSLSLLVTGNARERLERVSPPTPTTHTLSLTAWTEFKSIAAVLNPGMESLRDSSNFIWTFAVAESSTQDELSLCDDAYWFGK